MKNARLCATHDRSVAKFALFTHNCEIRGHRSPRREYTKNMSAATYHATIRLGFRMSAFAAACAVLLTLIGDVSTWSLVVSVAGIGFVARWVQSGPIAHAERRRPAIVVVDHTRRA